MDADLARLRAVLGIPAWAWLRQRLRRHLEEGRPLPAVVVLRQPTSDERRAANAVLATPGAGGAIRVELARLVQILEEAGLETDLRRALELCDGPILDRRGEVEADAAAWQAVAAEAQAQLADPHAQLPVLAAQGWWRRWSAGEAAQARAWISQAARLQQALRRRSAWHLAELAVQADGDAHALDRGAPLGRLILRLATGSGEEGDVLAWRRAWSALGVQASQTTAPVLVVNLHQAGIGPAAPGEMQRLTLRTVEGLDLDPVGRAVFVCENPSVAEVAAERLGSRCAPLVCVDGQPGSAALLLLDRLHAAGAHLLYHGDFDGPGLAIAAHLMARLPGLAPWRLGAADLAADALLPGPPLTAPVGETPWDPALAPALRARGRALHEESVLGDLLADLTSAEPTA
jgi:uncharacterized protein (TIGR02679 family)